MLEYAYGHDEIVADFAARLIPRASDNGFGPCRAIGVVEGTELIAGLVYHAWDKASNVIEISVGALPGRRSADADHACAHVPLPVPDVSLSDGGDANISK